MKFDNWLNVNSVHDRLICPHLEKQLHNVIAHRFEVHLARVWVRRGR